MSMILPDSVIYGNFYNFIQNNVNNFLYNNEIYNIIIKKVENKKFHGSWVPYMGHG